MSILILIHTYTLIFHRSMIFTHRTTSIGLIFNYFLHMKHHPYVESCNNVLWFSNVICWLTSSGCWCSKLFWLISRINNKLINSRIRLLMFNLGIKTRIRNEIVLCRFFFFFFWNKHVSQVTFYFSALIECIILSVTWVIFWIKPNFYFSPLIEWYFYTLMQFFSLILSDIKG